MNRIQIDHTTIIVTGGTSGLGFAAAHRALTDWPDLNVALLDMKEGRIEELTSAFGVDRINFFKTDVSDYQSVQDSFAGVVALRKSFSGLIAAAGFATNKASIETTPQEWRAMIGCHLDGTFFCNQAAGRFWIKNKLPGAIVNFSSVSHIFGWPRRISYAASKAGIDSITRTLSVEWAEFNIRVNAVVPGYINTPLLEEGIRLGRIDPSVRTMHAMERFGEADEIAAGVKFLLSNDASYITGEMLTIDGGFTPRRIPWNRD
ncbi:MAG: SDR family NAD(P)-dependent oxidoreductase [Actinomycetota bacterium]|nr:SDR family NAD(P)-dependent oxidoreductase [Actinomycetota bacterium]